VGLLLSLIWGSAALAAPEPIPRSGPITVARIHGSINPASSDYLQSAIRESAELGAAILILELDTPGGLVASTKDIIQAMLASQVPIAVYVSPQGAWAGSAGTFITLAANVAAMAPGSSIGAAHPVGIGGSSPAPSGKDGQAVDHGSRKAENLLAAFIESIAAKRKRNVEWAEKAVRESVAVTAEEARELNVIDVVVPTRTALIHWLDGRVIELDDGPVRLDLKGSGVREIAMPLSTRILNVIVDPNIAVMLLLAGLLGLYVEFNHPGMILPGAVGAICLILGLISMQILPFSWVGVLLMAVGVGFFVAEVFVTSYGLLFASGVICLLIGGSMLFDRPDLSDLNVSFWPVLVPAVGGFALFGGLVIFLVGRTLGRAQQSGTAELIGMVGTATTALDPAGTVFIRGEYWTAEAETPVAARERVEAVGVEGLRLKVRPVGRSDTRD